MSRTRRRREENDEIKKTREKFGKNWLTFKRRRFIIWWHRSKCEVIVAHLWLGWRTGESNHVETKANRRARQHGKATNKWKRRIHTFTPTPRAANANWSEIWTSAKSLDTLCAPALLALNTPRFLRQSRHWKTGNSCSELLKTANIICDVFLCAMCVARCEKRNQQKNIIEVVEFNFFLLRPLSPAVSVHTLSDTAVAHSKNLVHLSTSMATAMASPFLDECAVCEQAPFLFAFRNLLDSCAENL